MARGKKKGGYQAPSSPAPVSGPGALSARTDGGPGQPVRVPTGGAYGEAKALREQQQAAPLAAGGNPAPLGGSRRPVDPSVMQDPFRPTDRPGEPGTAGIPMGAGPSGPPRLLADDPDILVRTFAERLSRSGFVDAADRLLPYLRRG